MTGNKQERNETRLAVDQASTRQRGTGDRLDAEIAVLDEAHQIALERQITKARAEPGNHAETLDNGDTVYARQEDGAIHWGVNGGENSWNIAKGVAAMNRQRSRRR